jgi:hypothetical protein
MVQEMFIKKENHMITTLSQNEIERAMQLIREAEHRLHRGMNDLAHCHLLEAMDVLGLEKVGELEYDYS